MCLYHNPDHPNLSDPFILINSDIGAAKLKRHIDSRASYVVLIEGRASADNGMEDTYIDPCWGFGNRRS